jgi:1-acyl-sn-glycerol-3-phosphate acyltransferase
VVRTRDERDLLWRVASLILGALFRALFRVRTAGAGWIPASGPVVVAANHLSVLDGVALALAVSEGRRRVARFLAAAELFENPVRGGALRLFRQIPVRRGARDTAALEEAIAAVSRGGLLGIFPEGRVNPGTELLPGHTGVARIALAAGAPVVPAGIWGTQHRWPHGGLHLRRPWRPSLAIAFGPPLPPEGDPSSEGDVSAFLDRIMAAIADQVEAARALAEAR